MHFNIMTYRIKYNYDTGDSFNTYSGEEDYLELEFKKLDVAKENLIRIKEHYNQYKMINEWKNGSRKQEILDSNSNKDWYAKNSGNPEHCIVLYTDDGKPWQIYAPWCGYFESLNYVEIIPHESDMKYEFN